MSARASGLVAAARGLRALERCGPRGLTVASWLETGAAGPGPALRRARAPWRGALNARTRNEIYAAIWRNAAQQIGADVVELGGGFLEARRGGARSRIFQQIVALDDPVTLRLALDKPVARGLLAAERIPVAGQLVISLADLEAAERFLERHHVCVVKPAGKAGGDGTTTGVRTGPQLLRAYVHAARGGGRVLLEQQIEGTVHRLLLLDGELLDVLRHDRPQLTGDGHSTVEQLVRAENSRRAEAGGDLGLAFLELGLDARLTLSRQGLSPNSVIGAGHRFAVCTVTNDSPVDDSHTILTGVCEPVVDAARRAAQAVGLRLAGVDVIAPSLDRPLEECGGVIAEVNGNPGIHHHYLVADRPAARDVAVPILKAALSPLVPGGDSALT